LNTPLAVPLTTLSTSSAKRGCRAFVPGCREIASLRDFSRAYAGLLPGGTKSDESPQSIRRKSRSTSTSRIVQHDHRRSPDVARPYKANSSTARAAVRITQFVDDFPTVVPVTQRELDVLETYLGSLLDDLLKRKQ
jgi:hypothetical protein